MVTEREFEDKSILVLILKPRAHALAKCAFQGRTESPLLLQRPLQHHPPKRSGSRNAFSLRYAPLLVDQSFVNSLIYFHEGPEAGASVLAGLLRPVLPVHTLVNGNHEAFKGYMKF
jgi:hypothetical protein